MTIIDRNAGYDGLKLELANSFLCDLANYFARFLRRYFAPSCYALVALVSAAGMQMPPV